MLGKTNKKVETGDGQKGYEIQPLMRMGDTKEIKEIHECMEGAECRCIKEKKLVMARHFIRLGNKGIAFDGEDILRVWGRCFPDDFMAWGQKMELQYRDGNLILAQPKMSEDGAKSYTSKWDGYISWVVQYAGSHTLAECDRDIDKLRRKQERALKSACKYIRCMKCGAKLGRQPKNKLAVYHILAKGFHKSGNFSGMMGYVEKLRVLTLHDTHLLAGSVLFG